MWGPTKSQKSQETSLRSKRRTTFDIRFLDLRLIRKPVRIFPNCASVAVWVFALQCVDNATSSPKQKSLSMTSSPPSSAGGPASVENIYLRSMHHIDQQGYCIPKESIADQHKQRLFYYLYSHTFMVIDSHNPLASPHSIKYQCKCKYIRFQSRSSYGLSSATATGYKSKKSKTKTI